jgi:membrane-bound serine protease (ClpP class)
MTLSNAVRRAMFGRLARSAGALVLCCAAILLLAADDPAPPPPQAAAPAEAPPAEPTPAESKPAEPVIQAGRLIRVPLPITGSADTQVKRAVQKALSEMPPGESRPVLVFDFASTQNQFGQGSDFGRSLALARFLSGRELSAGKMAAKTVAYIPKALKGHAVLVAMACEEIVMAPDAQIGQAGIDEPAEEPIDPTIRSGYREIANRRRTIPGEVALGMLDKNVEVLKVETEVSPVFVLSTELDELRKKHTIQSQRVLSRAGQLAQFSGREARELGFVKYLAPDRNALAKALSLPQSALEDDPSLWSDWHPVLIKVKGPMNSQLVTRVERMIDEQIRNQGANFICLWISSQGGSLSDSMNLANFLAELDRGTIRTVAFVPTEARADAALVAMACDQLVLGRDAVLGGPGAAEFSADDLQLARETLRDNLAPKKSRSWSLIAALIDPETRVFRFTHRRDGLVEYFSEAELLAQADADGWNRGDEVTTAGKPLSVNGERAKELGLARHAVPDFLAFKEIYGLEDELVLAEPGWADYLIDALAAPHVAWLLLLIGGAALYAELQAPGIGIGGFVAGICFLLYFWSKHLDGTAGWLEILLFVAGVSCILLEMFVLPGTAIFGLGGGALVILSLVLASQTFVLPRNEYQMTQLRDSLLGLIAAGAGVIVLAMLMRRYLPHSPLFSHMMLEPPSGAELEDLAHREAMVELEHLLGCKGLATTQLTPSGKARFGAELVDVIADGEVVGKGAEVVVIGVQGNRVVVRSTAGKV